MGKRRKDKATDSIVGGAVIGGLLGGTPGAVIGGIAAAGLDLWAASTDPCYRCGGTGYATHSARGKTGFECSSCGRFWVRRDS